MKKAICLILLAMFLGTTVVPSFAQYRKPTSEMSNEELAAAIRQQKDIFETYTNSVRLELSAHIGQEISTGFDGLALVRRYYPHTLAWAEAKLIQLSSDPMLMFKSTKQEDKPDIGDPLKPATTVRDVLVFLWTTVNWMEEMGENNLELDLAERYPDYSNDRIEDMTEQISDKAHQANADFLRFIGLEGGAEWIELLKWIERGMEKERRMQLLRARRIPQPGPANGTPDGHPAPQGWIMGRPGGNGSSGRATVTTTAGGCVHITYDANNNPIITIVPCG